MRKKKNETEVRTKYVKVKSFWIQCRRIDGENPKKKMRDRGQGPPKNKNKIKNNINIIYSGENV